MNHNGTNLPAFPVPIFPDRWNCARTLLFFAWICLFSSPLFAQILVFESNANESETASEKSWVSSGGISTAAYNTVSEDSTDSEAFSGSPGVSNSSGKVVFAIPDRAGSLEYSPIRLVQATGSVPPFNSSPPSSAPGTGELSPGTLPGFSQSGNPNWDPYAPPGRSPLFTGPLFESQASTEFFNKIPDTSKKVARRFIERVSLDYTFLPRGNKDNGFGFSEISYKTEFTIPTCFLPEKEPIYIIPGVDLHWWDGPIGPPYSRHHFSPKGYGAYLEFGSAPRFNDLFILDISARFGVYSDYSKIQSDSLRITGKADIHLALTREIEGVFGIGYYNRQHIKLLPRFGIIWRPNEQVVWELVFPNPKLTRYLTRINNTDWSMYLKGDYGGGTWYIKDNADDLGYLTDYNEILLGAGLEFTNHALINGYVEFGGSFSRELYADGTAWCKPPSTIYLKAGFHF